MQVYSGRKTRFSVRLHLKWRDSNIRRLYIMSIKLLVLYKSRPVHTIEPNVNDKSMKTDKRRMKSWNYLPLGIYNLDGDKTKNRGNLQTANVRKNDCL